MRTTMTVKLPVVQSARRVAERAEKWIDRNVRFLESVVDMRVRL